MRNSAFAIAPNYLLRVLDERRGSLILDRIRRVPPGHVTTYGDLSPGAPRFAGQVLSECHDPSVPWQRVVRADGSLAKGERQRRLLEAEGVPFKGARVDMDVAWVPADELG
jgi:methylated-DNA-protein-cysteine methyltransferase related protein